MSRIASSPEFYPQKIDLARKRVLMIHMAEADYRSASFLDDRMLGPQSKGAWVDLETLLAETTGENVRPLHFIFHTGHVGSTLLSRLLDEASNTLPLREPLPLRTLAGMFDNPDANLLRDRALEAFIRLWSRGFTQTEAVVLKATSSSARIAPHLLEARPTARAAYMFMKAQPTIETLMSTRSSLVDIQSMGEERLLRLHKFISGQEIDKPRSFGELAALTWLVERLTQREIDKQFGKRILGMDFERFLEEPRLHVERVLDHLGLPTTPERVTAALSGPAMSRYSKKPQYPFSLQMRTQRLAEARIKHADEIARAHSWLDCMALRCADICELLD